MESKLKWISFAVFVITLIAALHTCSTLLLVSAIVNLMAAFFYKSIQSNEKNTIDDYNDSI